MRGWAVIRPTSSFPRKREPSRNADARKLRPDRLPARVAPQRHIYLGVTSHLVQRVHQHREGLIPGFTREYGVKMLVWFEQHATMDTAIQREKRIKKWNRAWKLDLIEKDNPDWRDLAEDFGFDPIG